MAYSMLLTINHLLHVLKKVIIWMQRMPRRTESVEWSRLVSFGHLGIISVPLMVSVPRWNP